MHGNFSIWTLYCVRTLPSPRGCNQSTVFKNQGIATLFSTFLKNICDIYSHLAETLTHVIQLSEIWYGNKKDSYGHVDFKQLQVDIFSNK